LALLRHLTCLRSCRLAAAAGTACYVAALPCHLPAQPASTCQHQTGSLPPLLPAVDKRLDEWVAQERLASITKVASVDALHRVASGGGGGSGDLGQLASDQKMTRRLKRQYTEIHHVPAALEELPPIDQVRAPAAGSGCDRWGAGL
jgi:hypothetical protein